MKIRNSLLLLIPLFIVISCNDNSNNTTVLGNWIHKSSLAGPARRDAVAFTIGNRAYISTGFNGTDRLKDLWEYDFSNNTWIKRAPMPESFQVKYRISSQGRDSIGTRLVLARNGAVAFGTDTKGYVGGGYDGLNALSDFYVYDPATNKWDTIFSLGRSSLDTTLPALPRYEAVAFCINNIGYVGTGWDGNNEKDFWAYDPATGNWSEKANFGGDKRMEAASFVIDGKAYVCTGINNGSYLVDFYTYDPATDAWTQLRNISNTDPGSFDDNYDIKRIKAVGFSMNGKGYISTGATNSVLNSTWEYDPATDLWTIKNPLEGSARADAVSFTVNNVGYIATGANSSYYFDDIWAFSPADVYNSLDK